MTILIAYHNDPVIKSGILATLAAHREADEIVKGYYWQEGKGCAVGCTIKCSNHMQYETRFGIPVILARLEDCIFEGLPNGQAKAWPERFMIAIKPGADLSRVGWQFLYWLLTNEAVNPGINHPSVRAVVRQCADVLVPLTKGMPVDRAAAWEAARAAGAAAGAAWAARAAAWAAAEAAWAARAAAEAAWAAGAAAEAARAAGAAAEAARAAGAAAEAARAAARAAAWVLMSGKLISLIEAA